MASAVAVHVGLGHTAACHGGRSESYAACLEGRACFAGNRIFVCRDICLVERDLRVLARKVGVADSEVDKKQVVVGSAGNKPDSALFQTFGECGGVLYDLLLVFLEGVFKSLSETDSLAGYDVHERAALNSGENSRVNRLRVFFAAHNDAAAGAAEGLCVVVVTKSQ